MSVWHLGGKTSKLVGQPLGGPRCDGCQNLLYPASDLSSYSSDPPFSVWLHATRLVPTFINKLLLELHDLSNWAQIFCTVWVTLTQTSGLVSCVSHDEHDQRFLSQPLQTSQAQSRLQFNIQMVG
jgi:hypothetical protein